MVRVCIIFFLVCFSTIKSKSQDVLPPDFLNIEFEFGLGYAQSTNLNYFNDSQGIRTGGGFGINLAFRYHFDYNWSAGVHMVITTDEIRMYDPDLVLGYFTENNLSTSNLSIGLGGKYTYDLSRWQPFTFGDIGLSLGGITTLDFEEQVNQFTGIAMDLGMGLGYMATNQLMVSVSGMRNFGIAWWKFDPSSLSVNNQFNPGFWSVTLNISFFISGDDM